MMRKNKSNIPLLVLLVCMSVHSAEAGEIATNAALMQAMDKVTGRVKEITIPVNSKIAYGDFSLVLRACKKRPAEETPENFAFIDVADKSFGSEEYNIFRGWVISSTPGISAIEHPIYDIWLLECIDTNLDNVKLLTEEELVARDNLPTKEKVAKQSNTIEENKEEEIKEEKVIHIKEFIQEDRDIEKNIKEFPAYISETNGDYISDIEEGEEPENLLLFTKMQEVDTTAKVKTDSDTSANQELSKAIDDEINKLRQN